MPSEGSLPKTSCGVLHMDAQGNPIPCPVGTEPQGSTNSSPDERCKCGLRREEHDKVVSATFHAFAPAEPDPMRLQLAGAKMAPRPAEPEAPDCWACKHSAHRAFSCTERRDGDGCGCGVNAVEPEAPECSHQSWECYGLTRKCADCGERLPDVEPLAEEPEAPEERPCPSCGQQAGDWFDRSVCAEPCGSAHSRCANCGAVTGDACLNEAPEAQPPRRPPYAVAYALEDGTAYEVALSGDATIRAVDGALIITHTSPIAGLTQARPMEGA